MVISSVIGAIAASAGRAAAPAPPPAETADMFRAQSARLDRALTGAGRDRPTRQPRNSVLVNLPAELRLTVYRHLDATDLHNLASASANLRADIAPMLQQDLLGRQVLHARTASAMRYVVSQMPQLNTHRQGHALTVLAMNLPAVHQHAAAEASRMDAYELGDQGAQLQQEYATDLVAELGHAILDAAQHLPANDRATALRTLVQPWAGAPPAVRRRAEAMAAQDHTGGEGAASQSEPGAA